MHGFQIALITGADSGIGRAVALAFAREGAEVAIAYLNEHEDAKVRALNILLPCKGQWSAPACLLTQPCTLGMSDCWRWGGTGIPQPNSRGKRAVHCRAWTQETKQVVEEAGRKAILIPGDIASEDHVKCAVRVL